MDVESEQGRNRFELRGNEFNPRLSVRSGSWHQGAVMGGIIIALLVLMLFGQVLVFVRTGYLADVTINHTSSADVRWNRVESNLGERCEKVGAQTIDNANSAAEKVMSHVDLVCRP